jgi:endonuclease/exonuclease/phosphatase family metal-dependent hydrolase
MSGGAASAPPGAAGALAGASDAHHAAQFVSAAATQFHTIVAGDFNDWGAQLLKPMAALDLCTFDGIRLPTYPSRLPLLHLDRIFVRGLKPLSAHVPHGRAWSRMSDHLPLIGEFEL